MMVCILTTNYSNDISGDTKLDTFNATMWALPKGNPHIIFVPSHEAVLIVQSHAKYKL